MLVEVKKCAGGTVCDTNHYHAHNIVHVCLQPILVARQL